MSQFHAPAAEIKPGAPTVGLVLQKSHINTKDECHYVALIAELEARGSKVGYAACPRDALMREERCTGA